MEPWQLDYHNNKIELYGNYISLFNSNKNFFARDLFWANGGNDTYFVYTLSNFLIGLLIFVNVFSTSLFSLIFRKDAQIWIFIGAYFLLTFLFFIDISGVYIYLNIVDMSKLVELDEDLFIISFFVYLLFYLVMGVICTIAITQIDKRKNLDNL